MKDSTGKNQELNKQKSNVLFQILYFNNISTNLLQAIVRKSRKVILVNPTHLI